MSLAEKIAAELATLPEPQQAEVLDFVQFLAARRRVSTGAGEKETFPDRGETSSEWMEASLASALRGMEDEPEDYSVADLKERFS